MSEKKKTNPPLSDSRLVKILPAAELLGIWAFREVLGESPPESYPHFAPAEYWEGVAECLPEGDEPPTPLSETETNKRLSELRATLATAQKQAEEILAFGKSDWAVSGLAVELRSFAAFSHLHLARLAEDGAGNLMAVESLAGSATRAANELCELNRRRPDLVKQIAEKFPHWPVNYSPHSDSIAELRREIDTLAIGTKSTDRTQGRWSNRPAKDQPFRAVIGKTANRIGQVLRTIHHDVQLRRAVKQEPQHWPPWIVEIVNLPKLDKDTAQEWFEAGWVLLKEAKVATRWRCGR